MPSLRRVMAGVCFESSSAWRWKPSLLCCAVGPSSQVTFSFWRAICACHQLSATMATPRSRPVKSVRAFDDEGVADAGHGLDFVEIGADALPANTGHFS